MALKAGDKIVAHTRLAIEGAAGITLFTPGEVVTIGDDVPAAVAQGWLDRGSAALPPKISPPASTRDA